MKKFIVAGLLIPFVVIGGVLIARPSNEEVAVRCTKRMQAFSTLLKTNQEVYLVFSGFIQAVTHMANQKETQISEMDALEAIKKVLHENCFKDEIQKDEI
jgi:hypothetical protein